MGKRKGRSEISETLTFRGGDDNDDEMVREEEREKAGGGGFFACYLLTSLSPRHKGHTYIGFTVNPSRRIRQHNGEMRCGAWRTKTKRPWGMVLCIYGFPTNVSALQFEWAWQHPTESLAVRKAAASFKTLGGVANKVKLAFTMLTLPAWQSLNLTMNYFSTKYTKFSAGCPKLPEHMKVQVRSMDELPCYTGIHHSLDDNDGDFDDEEECEENIKDRSTDTTVHYSVNHQNRTGEAINERDGGWVEDIAMKQSRDLLSPEDPLKRQGCFTDFTMQVSPSFVTRSYSELETMKDSPLIKAADKDQPPRRSLSVPCEVEIIDVLSPSPSYRTSSPSKKRRISSNTVCPEIIDLTKSPIFV